MALSGQQWRWIAARLLARTDADVCRELGTPPDTVTFWKQDAEFLREYNASFTDGIHVAQEYTRKLLGKAADTLAAALEANRTIVVRSKEGDDTRQVPDWQARLEAVKTLMQVHGLQRQRIDVALVRGEAERLAREYGLEVGEVLAEAERIVGRAKA